MRKIVFITSVSVLTLFFTAPVFADTCQPIYGGGITCAQSTLTLNKEVQNPLDGTFVDTLTSDTSFSPNQIVTFRLTVTNTSSRKVNNITIKDNFPQYVVYVAGDGSYNRNSNVLTISLPSLDAKQSKTYTVQGKIVTQDKLPADQTTTCVINQGIVSSGKLSSQDTTQLCINHTQTTQADASPQPTVIQQGQGGKPNSTLPLYPQPVSKKTPAAGPETISLLGLIPLALTGLHLRRKTK